MRTHSLTLAFLVTLCLAAQLAVAQDKPAPDKSNALLEADRAFDRDTAAKGLDGWMSWFADDARINAAAGIIQGRQALRAHYAPMFARKEFRIHWWPLHAEISADGNFGYTFGKAEFSWIDEQGNHKSDTGRYATMWRREGSGYKVVFDIGN